MDWKGKKVLVVGAARQGIALTRYLVSRQAQVILNDRLDQSELLSAQEALHGLPIQWVFGGHPFELLDGVDTVCLSGGVSTDLPLVVAARARGVPLANDSEIFLQAAPCPVIGVTGSSGKSTTTALLGAILEAAIQNDPSDAQSHQDFSWKPRVVWVGGNIGSPLIAVLDQMQPEDIAVMELSSFQLELMTRSPEIAVVLNISPNHLDRHRTMAAYTAAKARILDFQTPAQLAVVGRDDPVAWELADRVRGRMLTFGLSALETGLNGTYIRAGELRFRADSADLKLLNVDEVRLPGEHNLLNVLAACAAALGVNVPPQAVRSGVNGFTGLPHRLEHVRTIRGAEWINDSIATAPERTIAAIKSIEKPLILLAGGRDKDLPWEPLGAWIRHRVDHLIVFGEAAELVVRSLGPLDPDQRLTIDRCPNLYQAIQRAAQLAEAGDVVLLSPGGTSFDEFHDFEHRGECFKQWVRELL